MGLKPLRKVQCNATRHLELVYAIPNTPSGEVKVVGASYRYSDDSFINNDSFGRVYASIKDEFKDENSNVITCKAYALKRIEKVIIDIKDVHREVKLLVELSGECDKYIFRYHEVIPTTDFDFIVLELMDGDFSWFIADNQTRKLLEKNSEEMAQGALQMVKGWAFLNDQ